MEQAKYRKKGERGEEKRGERTDLLRSNSPQRGGEKGVLIGRG